VRAGEYEVGNRTDLWNLLGVITANKARMQARREAAAKRGGGRVIGEGALARPDGSPLSCRVIRSAAARMQAPTRAAKSSRSGC
jgi:hypothetical protein